LIENPGLGGMTKITYHPTSPARNRNSDPSFCEKCSPEASALRKRIEHLEQNSRLHSWQVLLSSGTSPFQHFHQAQADMIVNF